jgi:hypothetical protein
MKGTSAELAEEIRGLKRRIRDLEKQLASTKASNVELHRAHDCVVQERDRLEEIATGRRTVRDGF